MLKLRDRLEARTGRQSIPVWHINRRKEGFLRDLDHDYVAVGGLVNCHGKGRKVLKPLFPWLIDTAHEHGSAIHGLGYFVAFAFVLPTSAILGNILTDTILAIVYETILYPLVTRHVISWAKKISA